MSDTQINQMGCCVVFSNLFLLGLVRESPLPLAHPPPQGGVVGIAVGGGGGNIDHIARRHLGEDVAVVAHFWNL